MKKLMPMLISIFLLLALSACGSDNTKSNNEGKQGEKASKVSAEEIMEKATDANKDLNSFSTEMVMDMKMDIEGEQQEMTSTISMDVVTDPLSFKQVMEMDLDELPGKMEMYLVDNNFYMFEPSQEQWMKFPADFSDELGLLDENMGIEDQLSQFKDYISDFSVTEDGDNYVLTLNDLDGEKFNELLQRTMPDSSATGLDMAELIGELDFKKVEYTLYFDKKTYMFTASDIYLSYDLGSDEEQGTMEQKVKATYSNHNKIDEISIPQEAIDSAIEMEM